MKANPANKPTVEIGEANFEPEVLRWKQPVLVAFSSAWSRPCQILDSVLEEVAAACAGRVKVVRIHADNNPERAWRWESNLFQRYFTSCREVSAPRLSGLPASKRSFPNYNPSPTAIPKLSPPMQMMKMNTTISEHGSTESQRPYSAGRQQHQVTFFCDAPGAKTVTLAGDFNQWDPAATPMRRTPDGRWMASLELHHGHHRYRFLVDGTPTLDPNASGIARNDRNERVSLIAVS